MLLSVDTLDISSLLIAIGYIDLIFSVLKFNMLASNVQLPKSHLSSTL